MFSNSNPSFLSVVITAVIVSASYYVMQELYVWYQTRESKSVKQKKAVIKLAAEIGYNLEYLHSVINQCFLKLATCAPENRKLAHALVMEYLKQVRMQGTYAKDLPFPPVSHGICFLVKRMWKMDNFHEVSVRFFRACDRVHGKQFQQAFQWPTLRNPETLFDLHGLEYDDYHLTDIAGIVQEYQNERVIARVHFLRRLIEKLGGNYDYEIVQIGNYAHSLVSDDELFRKLCHISSTRPTQTDKDAGEDPQVSIQDLES